MSRYLTAFLFQSTPSVGRATGETYCDKCRPAEKFQSTPSVGRATIRLAVIYIEVDISIHALRGEGDGAVIPLGETYCAISIHALRGEGD